MKLLLTAINAKYIHSNLAVYSLRAYAKKYREQIEIAEYTINHTFDSILQGIFKACPDVLLFSCYIWNWEYVERLLKEIPKIMPGIPIWLGGPQVSFNAEEILEKYPQVAGVMKGEGERVFFNLAGCYIEGNSELDQIKGITYRRGDGKVKSNPLEEPMNLDELPFCYENLEDFNNRIIYYEASRGCPFSCSYCLSSIDRKLRFKSMEKVKRELLVFIERKVPQVKFVDRTANAHHDFCMELWRFIEENDNGVTNFHFEIAADLLTQDEIELLGGMRPGLVQLEIGVQSTNPDTIREICRVMDFEKVKKNVLAVKKNGNIHQHLDLIAGLPHEDLRSFQRSFDDVYALRPEQLQLGFLKVLTGAAVGENAEKYGLVWQDRPPYEVLKTADLSYADVLKLKQVEEVLEVYYNSGQFPVTMGLLVQRFGSPYECYENLADYYERRGLFAMSHTRVRRAEILLDFICDLEEDAEVDMYREALIFDLYLREKMKSLPAWAKEHVRTAQEKEIARTKGRNLHGEEFHYDFTVNAPYCGERIPPKKRMVVQFDYDKRNPLTNQAELAIFEIEGEIGC